MAKGADIANTVFSSCSDIELVVPFSEDGDKFQGKVLLLAKPRESLELMVHIPKSYPLSDSEVSVRFFVEEHVEAAHINLDQSICIHTPSHHDFQKRLENEIKMLLAWRDRYYIRHTKDVRYDYLSINYSYRSCFLFTDINHQFEKGDFGEFTYTLYGDHKIKDGIAADQAYILSIGKHQCTWSTAIHQQKALKGYHVFIEDEPISRPFRVVTNWDELTTYLPAEFLNALYQNKKAGHGPHQIAILIGYRIPDSDEIHWQLITVRNNEIPIYGEKIAPKTYVPACSNLPINWSKTVNASYNRFFGRGKLTNQIADKKILIIGIGAIGSGLANILTRGGVRHLDFCDYDIVEPGNICRSEYYIIDSQLPKIVALRRHLESMSPFVDINIHPRFSKRRDGEEYDQTRQKLNGYDIIIDCSSDNELSFFLDGLSLDSTIMNISISNAAEEMVLVTGRNITTQKHTIFQKLSTDETELIYEGTGCWSPTFKAAYYDIQSQLNLMVQNINHQYESVGHPRTIMIKREIENYKLNLTTIDY